MHFYLNFLISFIILSIKSIATIITLPIFNLKIPIKPITIIIATIVKLVFIKDYKIC